MGPGYRGSRRGESGTSWVVLSAEAACSQKLSLCLFICGLAALQCKPYRHEEHKGGDTTREDPRHIVACSRGDDNRGTESSWGKMCSTLFGLVHVIFSCEAFRPYYHFLCGCLRTSFWFICRQVIILWLLWTVEKLLHHQTAHLWSNLSLNLSMDPLKYLMSFSDFLLLSFLFFSCFFFVLFSVLLGLWIISLKMGTNQKQMERIWTKFSLLLTFQLGSQWRFDSGTFHSFCFSLDQTSSRPIKEVWKHP